MHCRLWSFVGIWNFEFKYLMASLYFYVGLFIGSGLFGFEPNRISSDQTVRFFQFNGLVNSVFFLKPNYNLGSVRFGLENFKTEITEPTELLYIMNLIRTASVYFLINYFKYFDLFLNILIYFLILQFIS